MTSPITDSESSTDRTPRTVRRMFAGIAGRYDLANRVLSLGCDVYWRGVAARRMAPGPGQRALDLACGTGDLAVALTRRGGEVVGVDFTHEMLVLASRRTRAGVQWAGGDALRLPFADETFDRLTVSFGVRNFVDLDIGLAEMARVLRIGGRVGILEFSRPVGPLAPASRFYMRSVVPSLGALVAGDRAPYTYLAETIRTWPDQAALAKRLSSAGFAEVTWRNLTGGVAAFHTGRRED